MSDGSHHDVHHPEIAAVSAAEVVIGLEPFEDDVPTSFAYCDPIHITRVEPINGDSPNRSRKKRLG